jgi:hypothetical protein
MSSTVDSPRLSDIIPLPTKENIIMGYCITMDIQDLYIPLENVSKALKAINALHKDQKTIVKKGGIPTVYSYSWVDTPPEGGFKSLEEAFDAWRYSAHNEDGNCVVDYFTGEKLGNCNVLWEAVAKYVNPKAIITCRGEDGAQWRWIFKDGKFKEQTSKVIWED